MTGHTDLGRSLKRSPAIIEESSMTHAPSLGDRCRPRPSWTVWKVGSGIVTLPGAPVSGGRSSNGRAARASPLAGDPPAGRRLWRIRRVLAGGRAVRAQQPRLVGHGDAAAEAVDRGAELGEQALAALGRQRRVVAVR